MLSRALRRSASWGKQELDADVEGSSRIDPGDFHPAAGPASWCGHVHDGLYDHRPGWIHNLEAVDLGVEVSQVGGAEHR